MPPRPIIRPYNSTTTTTTTQPSIPPWYRWPTMLWRLEWTCRISCHSCPAPRPCPHKRMPRRLLWRPRASRLPKINQTATNDEREQAMARARKSPRRILRLRSNHPFSSLTLLANSGTTLSNPNGLTVSPTWTTPIVRVPFSKQCLPSLPSGLLAPLWPDPILTIVLSLY